MFLSEPGKEQAKSKFTTLLRLRGMWLCTGTYFTTGSLLTPLTVSSLLTEQRVSSLYSIVKPVCSHYEDQVKITSAIFLMPAVTNMISKLQLSWKKKKTLIANMENYRHSWCQRVSGIVSLYGCSTRLVLRVWQKSGWLYHVFWYHLNIRLQSIWNLSFLG